jgi:TusA-related sulfurtransferase
VKQSKEIRVNARGLSNPGPRMMVEQALEKGGAETLRIVVSSVEALEDLRSYFTARKASFETDHIGADYYLQVDLTAEKTG